MTSTNEEFLTVAETAELLHMSPKLVRSLIRRKVIPGIQVSERKVLVPRQRLIEALEENLG